MAATTNPLVWEFYREVDGAQNLGSVVEYNDESSQSLYLASGFKTRVADIYQGHWREATVGDEVVLSEDDYSAMSWDHPLTGYLYGVAIIDDELEFMKYRYTSIKPFVFDKDSFLMGYRLGVVLRCTTPVGLPNR